MLTESTNFKAFNVAFQRIMAVPIFTIYIAY